jgi:hypothetical protein
LSREVEVVAFEASLLALIMIQVLFNAAAKMDNPSEEDNLP